MARNRMLQADDTTCEAYANCSRDARYLFDRMACFCDDGGVHPDSAKSLKMSVFPGDEDLTSADVQRILDELLAHDLLIRFAVSEVRYLFVAEWSTRQRVDKPRYRYPQPSDGQPVPENSTTPPRTFGEQSPTSRGEVDDESSSVLGRGGGVAPTSRPELKGKEEKPTEENGSERETTHRRRSGNAGRFVPPSIEEVSRYCQQRGNSVPVAKFMAYYQSNGWKVGKNPMRDWRAAVHTWEQSEQQLPRSNGQGGDFFQGLKDFVGDNPDEEI